MHITCVHIRVIEGSQKNFIAATMANHEASRREPGNIRFDVLQSPADSCVFQLIEVYTDEEAARFHKTTGHYLAWRETVAPMMAVPREGIPWTALAPADEEAWR